MIDRNKVRKLAEKPPIPDEPTQPPTPPVQEGLIDFLEAVEPDLARIEKILATLKGKSGRTAGQFGRLATADPTGRYIGLQTIAEEHRGLQTRAAEALERARTHERNERARRRTRGRKSRPELASDEQRELSDRLARAVFTLEKFVSGFAKMGELVT